MRERKHDPQPLPVYESHPPGWLPKAHNAVDLGYPGFHPPRPGQDEDVLTEANVRNGFVLPHYVSAETFSAQAMINENLHSNDTLLKLEELMNEIFMRRTDRIPAIPPSTFRMPTRVTLNDSKRQAWFADLANPDVPLHKLGKSVPHGAKGHELLDLLHSKNVAIPRAVWFLRVLGANETAGLRNKPTYNPAQFSVDWANLVTGYMKKQLADIALPSAPRPGLNIKQTFKAVLAGADTRERWISCFSYTLKLLRTFYSEGLVDNRTFLIWVVQQMGSCNLAQAGFIARLADDYLDGMIGSRALCRPFVDACLCKLSEIRATSAQEILIDTERLMKTLLQRVCLSLPDAFVSPRLWTAHSMLLENVLTENIMDYANNQHIEQNSREIHQMLLDNFSDIERRNEAMLFRNLPARVFARLGTHVPDVKLLNSISGSTDMTNVAFFTNEPRDTSTFVEKLEMLLTWSVTPLQYGDHRSYAAVTLIRIWREKAGDRANRRDFSPPDEFLQDKLFDWLDTSDVAGEPDNIRAVALLYGELVKHELFSYAGYIQRLIARGEPGLSNVESDESRHRNFLRWIPLVKSTSSLISQRKVTLYGARARETPEDLNEREIRREIRVILPELFGGDSQPPPVSTAALSTKCSTLLTAPRFEQVRTLKQWFLPILKRSVSSQEPHTSHPTLLKSYAISVELMAHAKCFHSILDLTLHMLECSSTADSLNAVINTLHRFSTMWACMNVMGTILAALDSAHQLWKIRGIQSRALLALSLEFDNGRHLTEASRERVIANISTFTLALHPITDRPAPVPDVLPEILLLAGDPDEDAPSILANGLWIKYRTSYDWAWKVWDNTVASLRQVPEMTSDIAGRQACALRYGAFLWHIDQHLPNGLDDQVLGWFLGPGKNEVAALSADAWDVLTIVLLYLSVRGALKTTTILTGLVYPAWQLGASASEGQQGHSLGTFIHATNNLCRCLLLCEDGTGDKTPPTDLLEVQCIRTWQQDVFYESHFPTLIGAIPLLISLENNTHIPPDLRRQSTSLRQNFCQDKNFRQGAYRHLDAIREAFEQFLQPADEATDDSLCRTVIAGLRILLCDGNDDIELSSWPKATCLLSPWKIAATTIQLQFLLRQLGRTLVQDATHRTASADLDKLTLMIFHHSMTSEEAFYVAEMARGVDCAVTGKFINNGLKCIAEILNELIAVPDTLSQRLRRIGELLQVLVYISEPMQQESSLPALEPSIQDTFIDALYKSFALLESLLLPSDPSEGGRADASDLTQGTILLARLLQFNLGFRDVWTPKTKETGSSLSMSIFRLALFHGTGECLDPTTYPLLVDTLFYLGDETPGDTKTMLDPFKNHLPTSASELPPDLPPEYRRQLMSLLPQLPSNASVLNLVNSHRDSSGNLVPGTPVINRPWEWIENLGEPAVLDPVEEERDRDEKERLRVKYLVKNSGSLSLDNFGARITGDGIFHHSAQENDTRVKGNLLSFEDGLSAETVFKRDWRETRVELEAEALMGSGTGRPRGDTEHELGLSSSFPGSHRIEKRTPRASPSSSIVSRSSARGSTASIHHSPSQASLNRLSGSTVSDVIDLESMTTASSSKRTSKRKAAAAVSDDEIEIIEGPIPSRASTGSKKPKTKASTKAKAKRK